MEEEKRKENKTKLHKTNTTRGKKKAEVRKKKRIEGKQIGMPAA